MGSGSPPRPTSPGLSPRRLRTALGQAAENPPVCRGTFVRPAGRRFYAGGVCFVPVIGPGVGGWNRGPTLGQDPVVL